MYMLGESHMLHHTERRGQARKERENILSGENHERRMQRAISGHNNPRNDNRDSIRLCLVKSYVGVKNRYIGHERVQQKTTSTHNFKAGAIRRHRKRVTREKEQLHTAAITRSRELPSICLRKRHKGSSTGIASWHHLLL